MRTLASAFLIACLILGGAGCKRSKVGAGTALQMQLWAEPVSLDPALAEDGVALRVLGNVMDGLMGVDSQGNLEHRLASGHTFSPDGLRYVFQLRGEAAWSDGVPVLAKHVVDGILRGLDPKTGAKFASLLYPIRGARDFNTGKGPREKVGVRTEGHDKVVFELEKPAPYFLSVLSLQIATPTRPELTSVKYWTEKTPVTGPYKIAYHRIDDSILLAPNEFFWGTPVQRKAPTRPVMLRIVPDESTALNLFESGMLDILIRFPATETARVQKLGSLKVDPFLATYYLAFNTRKAPFQDRQLRRAVSGAIDREGIVRILGSGEQPARSWISPGLEGFIPWSDPARDFADSVKVWKGRKLPKVELGFDATARNSAILEKVQADLKTRLGLELSLEGRDWKAHLKQVSTDAPSLYRMGWQATFPDPLPHLQVFTSDSPSNATGWKSAEYDALVERVAALAPGQERAALVRRAQEILVDREAVVVPLFHYVQSHALSRRILKMQVNPFGVIRFNEIEMASPAGSSTGP
jgi:oligopeptide transport system substrate-binding protein